MYERNSEYIFPGWIVYRVFRRKVMDPHKIFILVNEASLQTLEMVLFSTIFSLVLGMPLGILLCTSDPQSGIKPRPVMYQVLTRIVNALRSFPFIILMIILFPLSRIIVGTSIGTKATIVPLSIAAAPFVARIIESALKEVDAGVVQAARAMGSSTMQIILKVLIPEAMPSLIDGVTLTIINLIGYSAMAGAIGGGGLGDLAIRYGYQRFRPEIMAIAVVVILIMVEIIQFIGTRFSHKVAATR
jgi:D-methionine transport system permease protein